MITASVLHSRDLVELDNGGTRLVVDLDLGAEIRWLGTPEANLLASYDWTVPAERRTTSGGEWLRQYRGGWQTLFPNIGPDSAWEGASLGHHGSWSRTRVEVLAHEHDHLVVTAATPHGLRLTRDFRLTSEGHLEIRQVIANPGDTRVPYVLGEHPAFDLPSGSLLELPPGPVHVPAKSPEFGDLVPGSTGDWPFAPGPTGDVDLSAMPAGPVERTCYLPDRTAGRLSAHFAVPHGGLAGFELDWDATALPHLCLWQQIGGRAFPYLGRARITAIELLSTWPSDGLASALGRGDGSWLEPGETRATDLVVRPILDREDHP